jgi:hypothetical protein
VYGRYDGVAMVPGKTPQGYYQLVKMESIDIGNLMLAI